MLTPTLQLKITLSVTLPLFIWNCACVAQGLENSDESSLLGLYGDESMISIATGMQQSIAKAPAVASIITAEAIETMGAIDLDEVLENIPGLHVNRNSAGYNPIYTFRGIHSTYNPQVLVLINGIPLTNLFQGDRGLIWGGMPIKAIERIEVIRGPGSAVYGADAFAGVINIQTKTATDINETMLSVSRGSFNTTVASFLYGGNLADVDVALSAEYLVTDGHEGRVESDAQTNLDAGFGTDASLAPGNVNLSRENLDLRLDLGKGDWRFRSGLQQRSDVGNGAGIAEALDPTSRFKSNRINADLTWEKELFGKDLHITSQISYLRTTQEREENLIIFPPGVVLPDGQGGTIGPYPDGFIGNPEVWEKHNRFNLTANYWGIDSHSIRLGTGYYHGHVYRVRETKNYGIDPATGLPLSPTSDLVDVSDTPYIFLPEGQRENHFVFLQDIWKFSRDWELTAGIRYDDYSDFGSTTNPRLALVWSATQRLTTKFLYSQAFRAPSFAETRAINNPIVLGNPNLAPETLESREFAFDYRASEALNLNINVFQYQWTDIINFVPDTNAPTSTARNDGERDGIGLEFELAWQLVENIKLSTNYAYVNTEDQKNNREKVGLVPHQQLFMKVHWDINNKFLLYSQLNHIMDREREPSDSRTNINDNTLLNIILSYTVNQHIETRLAVKNVFDNDAKEPSIWSNPVPNIPNDLPLAGRDVRIELKYTF